MNAGELIEKLNNLPKDAKIVIAGFEGGFQEFDNVIFPLNIKHDCSDSWLVGPYKETDGYSAEHTAVLLGARRR